MTENASGLQAALVRFSVRLPRVVLALACAVLVFGLYALAGARFDVFPNSPRPPPRSRPRRRASIRNRSRCW